MSRTTEEAVAGIIEVDDSISVLPFIDIANQLVTECCVSTSYDDTRLEMIERYLAAHFYTNRDPRASQEAAGSVSTSYQNAVALGFDSSFYGQTAMRLDTAGGLASLNSRAKNGKGKVSFTWLGKESSEIGSTEL